jgi:hypothetical protein
MRAPRDQLAGSTHKLLSDEEEDGDHDDDQNDPDGHPRLENVADQFASSEQNGRKKG